MSARPEDDLTIPAFLRRPVTEEGKKRSTKIVEETVRGTRQWIMPDMNKYRNNVLEEGEDDMAKKAAAAAEPNPTKIQTQDPNLPVMMELTKHDGNKETRRFENLEEFFGFYKAKEHNITGSVADASVTMVTVEEKAPPAANKKTGDKKQRGKNDPGPGAIPQPEKTKGKKTVDRGAVIKKGGKKEAAAKTSGGRGGSRAGVPRHGCKVNGKEPAYGSVWKAFQDLRLGNEAECVKFRNVLKASKTGKETFEKDGKKYVFELVEKE